MNLFIRHQGYNAPEKHRHQNIWCRNAYTENCKWTTRWAKGVAI